MVFLIFFSVGLKSFLIHLVRSSAELIQKAELPSVRRRQKWTYCDGQNNCLILERCQIPLFHFSQGKDHRLTTKWINTEVGVITVLRDPQTTCMFWQFHGLLGQSRRLRKRSRSRKAISTELEWRKVCSSSLLPPPYGSLSRRPPSKVLVMKAQGLGLKIRKEHDYPKELESMTAASETVILWVKWGRKLSVIWPEKDLAFVMAYYCSWKITHRFSTRSQMSQWIFSS